MLNKRFQQSILLAVVLIGTAAVVVFAQPQLPWREPGPGAMGGAEAPLSSTAVPQTKLELTLPPQAGHGLDVADVWIKSFANYNDEAQNFRQRGELLSNILRGASGGLSDLAPGGTRVFTPRPGGISKYRTAEARCNPGEVLVSCFGSRDAEMVQANDQCNSEDGCRLLGTEPIDASGRPVSNPSFVPPAVGCRTGLLYQRSNLEPVAVAYCTRLERQP